jgi:hypothetical protein
MSVRLIPLVAALCLTSCSARAEGQDFRPEGTGSPPYDARIVTVRGDAKVVIAKVLHPATPDFALLKGDRIEVPTGGFVVLELLGNHYIVTVDEELALEVRDIALLGAPPAKSTVEDQLSALIQRGDIRKGDRVAGYQQRIQAFESFGEKETKVARKAAKREELPGAQAASAAPARSESTAQGAAPAPPPAAPAPAPKVVAVAKPTPVLASESREEAKKDSSVERHKGSAAKPRTDADDDGDRGSAAGGGRAAGPVWKALRSGRWERQGRELPVGLASRVTAAAACLPELAPGLRHEEVRLKIVGHRVEHVALGSGLMPPDCIIASLRGADAPDVDDGWIAIEVQAR